MATNRYCTCLSSHGNLEELHPVSQICCEARFPVVKSLEHSSKVQYTELECCSARQAKQLFIKYIREHYRTCTCRKIVFIALLCNLHISAWGRAACTGSTFRKVCVCGRHLPSQTQLQTTLPIAKQAQRCPGACQRRHITGCLLLLAAICSA